MAFRRLTKIAAAGSRRIKDLFFQIASMCVRYFVARGPKVSQVLRLLAMRLLAPMLRGSGPGARSTRYGSSVFPYCRPFFIPQASGGRWLLLVGVVERYGTESCAIYFQIKNVESVVGSHNIMELLGLNA